jgi:hypothetical protein
MGTAVEALLKLGVEEDPPNGDAVCLRGAIESAEVKGDGVEVDPEAAGVSLSIELEVVAPTVQ